MTGLRIIGRDYMLVDRLAKQFLRLVQQKHEWTDLRDTEDGRGRTFTAHLLDEDGPTNRIVRITVELDHVRPL